MKFVKKHLWKIIPLGLAVVMMVCIAIYHINKPDDSNQTYELKYGTYCYIEEGMDEMDIPAITINEDNTFTYVESSLSSYIGVGTYTKTDTTLTLTTNDGHFIQTFAIKENSIVYDASNSTGFLFIFIADGSIFIYQEN